MLINRAIMRTEQNRTEQNRTEQNRTEQNRGSKTAFLRAQNKSSIRLQQKRPFIYKLVFQLAYR